MKRKQDGLVPITDALSERDVSMTAIPAASPQARHHFTLADQVDQLVTVSDADHDRGFMARMMALCSLPRAKPRQPAPVQARQRPVHALYDRLE